MLEFLLSGVEADFWTAGLAMGHVLGRSYSPKPQNIPQFYFIFRPLTSNQILPP